MAPVGGALSSKADDRSPAGADWVDAMEAWWTEEPGGDWSRHRDGKHHLAKVRVACSNPSSAPE
jgi:hypothetical protein